METTQTTQTTYIDIAKQFLKARVNQYVRGIRGADTPNLATNVTLKIGETLKLTQEDMKYSILKGRERYWNDHKAGVPDQGYESLKSGMDKDIQGVFGEVGLYRMVDVTDFSLLDDTRPQGIQTDRGDIVIDGLKIDVKNCEGGDWNDLWVRLNSFNNPSKVYVLFTFPRGSQALPRVNTKDDTEQTFVENEDIVLTFRGAVSAYDLFHPSFIQIRKGGKPFYVYPPESLLNLEDAITRFKKQHVRYNADPEIQKVLCCLPQKVQEEVKKELKVVEEDTEDKEEPPSTAPPSKKRRTH
jgi:hypothetical protein